MVRMFLLTATTMVAFAANSLLNRAALIDGETGPAAFAALRLVSGAFCLALLLAFRNGLPKLMTPARTIGAGTLAMYVLGFSFAYVALDAGIGALILFGMVQLTMFGAAVVMGERPAPTRWIGSVLALVGLAWLVWPSGSVQLPLDAVVLMAAAGVAWGGYSLNGRSVADPIQQTGANFICATPIALAVFLATPDRITANGATLAIISGAVTSGLGYALWYSVLPRLEATIAALAQLTVPVITVIAGVLFLSETLTLRTACASALILGGVAFGILGHRISGSRGS